MAAAEEATGASNKMAAVVAGEAAGQAAAVDAKETLARLVRMLPQHSRSRWLRRRSFNGCRKKTVGRDAAVLNETPEDAGKAAAAAAEAASAADESPAEMAVTAVGKSPSSLRLLPSSSLGCRWRNEVERRRRR